MPIIERVGLELMGCVRHTAKHSQLYIPKTMAARTTPPYPAEITALAVSNYGKPAVKTLTAARPVVMA